MKHPRLLLPLIILMCSAMHLYSQFPQWKSFGNLTDGRNSFEAVAINDHQIFVMGGYFRSSPALGGTPMLTCEIIDLRQRRTLPLAAMLRPRAEFVALPIGDSSVIVMGGMTTVQAGVAPTAAVEKYNPSTGAWVSLGNMLVARKGHTAAFIDDTTVLVVGGMINADNATESAELFNIVTGQSRPATSYPVTVNQATAVSIDSGRVLVFGGRQGNDLSGRLKDIQMYLPATNKWVKAGDLTEAVSVPQVIRLHTGRLMISGGVNRELFPSRQVVLQTASGFGNFGSMTEPRGWHGLAQWDSLGVIAVGGIGTYDTVRSTTDWIDLKFNTISQGPRLATGRSHFRLIALPIRDTSGVRIGARILAISGLDTLLRNTPTIEILEPDCTPRIISAGPSRFCEGDSVQLDAGPGYQRYQWSTGATARSIIVRSSGSYTVTTTDENGCMATSPPMQVVVVPVPRPAITSSRGLAVCEGDSVTLDAGAFTTYQWSTGQTTRRITVSTAGFYSVTVMTTEGCAGTSTPVELVVHPPTVVPPIERYGDTLVAGAFRKYQWYRGDSVVPGAISRRLVARESGNYSVVVTDSNGCVATSAPLVVTVVSSVTSLEAEPLHFRFDRSAGSIVIAGEVGIPANLRVAVVDLLGRTVLTKSMVLESRFMLELPLGDLPIGTYFVRLSGGSNERFWRFIRN